MDRRAWSSLLSSWAAEAAERAGMPESPEPLSGLGFPGATEEALQQAEKRLGCSLPPSYREFLKCTNGLRQPHEALAASGGHFWSAQEIDWFRIRNSEWIAAYMSRPYEVP